MTPLIEMSAVTLGHTFRTPFNLEIRKGDKISVSGPSGAGKTTLLRAISYLEPFCSGEIRWQGQPILDIPKFRSQVIYLHQKPYRTDGNVEDNLRRVFEFRCHRDKSYSRDFIQHHLTLIEMESAFLNKTAANLSEGEAQIMSCLRAIQLRPVVLLLDEPTASLDSQKATGVEKIIQTWSENNGAYLWTTHNSEQAKRMCPLHWGIEKSGGSDSARINHS